MSTGSRELLFIFVFLTLVFAIMGFASLDELYDERSIAARIGLSLLFGADATLFMGCFMWLYSMLFDSLPNAIRRAMRTPMEKYTDLVNSRTALGAEERDRLKARLTLLVESEEFRKAVYLDREVDQYWTKSYVESSWTSYHVFDPVDAERAQLLIANFERGENG